MEANKTSNESLEKENIDFDQLCKRLIKAFFKEFLDFFYPELIQKIDFNTEILFIDKELYSGQIEGEKSISDILTQVTLLDGQEEILLLHFEIQSGKEDSFPERMFNYYIDIWREYKKKIFAFALFIDDAVEWRIPISNTFHMEFMGTGVTYKYHLRKTKNYNYRDYLEHDNPITAALMTRMKYGKDSRAIVKAEALKKLKKYHLSPLQEEILKNFIDRLLFLNEKEENEFKEIIHNKEKFKEVSEMLTTWEQKAMEKGLEKGLERGKAEGEFNKSRNIARNLLKMNIPVEQIARATELSIEEIQKLMNDTEVKQS
ncbi:MAG: Rpn family recombination-promoting nuclease/putative transposase [Candidatus Eremiobacterota bacterium]